jgi:hypothetical protein
MTKEGFFQKVANQCGLSSPITSGDSPDKTGVAAMTIKSDLVSS